MVESWQAAEEFAAAQMRGLGFQNVALTGPGVDQGIDVAANGAVAQVKHLAQPVGRPTVQQLIGTGGFDDQLLLFSLGGYTAGAVETADQYSVALFSYTVAGEMSARNETARALRETGWIPATGDSDIAEFVAVREAVGRYIIAVLARSVSAWEKLMPIYASRVEEFAEHFLDISEDEYSAHLNDPALRAIADQHIRDRREFRWVTNNLMPLVQGIADRTLKLSGTVPEVIIRYRRIENIVAGMAAANGVEFESGEPGLVGYSVDGLKVVWRRS